MAPNWGFCSNFRFSIQIIPLIMKFVQFLSFFSNYCFNCGSRSNSWFSFQYRSILGCFSQNARFWFECLDRWGERKKKLRCAQLCVWPTGPHRPLKTKKTRMCLTVSDCFQKKKRSERKKTRWVFKWGPRPYNNWSNNILFASRYPTSPSEGSFLYDCLKEGLQTKEELEHFELEAAIIGTCKPPFWVIRHSIESCCRDL